MNILEVEQLRIWDALTEEVIVPNSSFQLKQGECLAIRGKRERQVDDMQVHHAPE